MPNDEDEDSKIIYAKVDPFFGNEFEYNGYLIGTEDKNLVIMTVKRFKEIAAELDEMERKYFDQFK